MQLELTEYFSSEGFHNIGAVNSLPQCSTEVSISIKNEPTHCGERADIFNFPCSMQSVAAIETGIRAIRLGCAGAKETLIKLSAFHNRSS